MKTVKVFNIWCGVYVGDDQYEGGSWEDFELEVDSNIDEDELKSIIEFELINQYEDTYPDNDLPDVWEFDFKIL